jgi:tartrate-resistant acid phosphatase type 5
MRSGEAECIFLRRVSIFATFPGHSVVNELGGHARPYVRGETVQAPTCFYAGLCVFWMFWATGCIQPIAPEVLLARLHPRDPARSAVTFVAFGDMGDGSVAQTQVAHAMYSVCQREGCDFVLGLGDNIYPHSVHSVHDPAFQAKFEQPYARFQGLDFWMILGNHDWKQLLLGAQAQVDYTLHSDRWRLPAVHYAIPFLPPWLHLYGVDTSLLEAGVGVLQLPAAQTALCGQPGWRLLFGHYPTRSTGAEQHGSSWFVRDTLEQLIRTCHIQVYFAGHEHHQAHLDMGFYQEIIEGAGGAELAPVRAGAPQQRFGQATHGFAWVRVTAERLTIRLYDVEQTVLYAWEMAGTSL